MNYLFLQTTGQRVADAALGAFLHSFSGGALVAAGVAAAGSLLAFALLPARPRGAHGAADVALAVDRVEATATLPMVTEGSGEDDAGSGPGPE